jgi:transcriptional regulator with GAF, ATPase, and Fis domain
LIVPSAHNALGRVIATKRPVHITDYTQETADRLRDPLALSIVELAGARTLVIVPMLRERELIGNLWVKSRHYKVTRSPRRFREGKVQHNEPAAEG